METNQTKNNTFTEDELKAARAELTSTEGFIIDPRFKICSREAKLGVGLGIFNLILWFGFGYGFGSGPVSEYTYVLGLPLWFFLSCIVTPVIIVILVFYYTGKMADMSLEAMTEEEAVEYEAMQRRMKK